MGRVSEITWLRNLASNITFRSDSSEGTAEELVDHALSDEGRLSWGIIWLPDWFSMHDRRVLIALVAEGL